MTGTSFGDTDAQVGVIMGSRNDWETMKNAVDVLDELGIRAANVWSFPLIARRRGWWLTPAVRPVAD